MTSVSCENGTTATDDASRTMETDAWRQNAKLLRTVNLGNIFEAPYEGAWGITMQPQYLPLIKQAGFTAVRIPIRWSAHALADSPYTIDKNFLDRIDWVIGLALNYDLAVVINIHHYEELMTEPDEHKDRFLGLWRNLALHYKNRPDDVIFEILNEPNNKLTASLWNSYLAEAIIRIREIDPQRTLMAGTADWGGIASLSGLVIPDSVQNIIVTVHYYNPFQFTHQGAEWVSGSDAWLGTGWNGLPSERSALESDLDTAADWSQLFGRPVFIGEFGAYQKADMTSRALWSEAVARGAEQRGMSWGYWEFCAGFGVYNPTAASWNEPLLNALIP